ncbi:cysteine peptidase family C39 domain-containing protein [Sphingobacterium sp. UME9]|uniref:cysteine peptidase family C39 domain-containing protein n=1 Tax=Sphingobacterium TaxID=28453 RepID=UPI001C8166BB|nr:cysteine peptidase family C39 domain-containing protein [Sphingobacterium sp. UME9]MBB1642791.1 hypothetical protein [Sphingobacterium sp. UME9]
MLQVSWSPIKRHYPSQFLQQQAEKLFKNITSQTSILKQFPFYKQMDAMDCSPTCVRMITKFYGKNYSLENLCNKSYLTRDGVSMRQFERRALTHLGVSSKLFSRITSFANACMFKEANYLNCKNMARIA